MPKGPVRPSSASPLGLYLQGAGFGLAAVLIWAGWLAYTRLSVFGVLNAFDIAAIRFFVAGLVLLPLVFKIGLLREKIKPGPLLLMIAGAGAPYVLLIAKGLEYAPSADAGALFAGLMPFYVALISAFFLGERFSRPRKVGFGCIVAGVMILIGLSLSDGDLTRLSGHGFFACAALFWAVFTVVMRHHHIQPLQASALVSVGSFIGYVPLYFSQAGLRLFEAELSEIVLQAIYQGVLTSIIALVLFARAVALLGASSGAAFAALLPGFTALVAIPVTGEIPALHEWALFFTISVGVYLASGGPLKQKLSKPHT